MQFGEILAPRKHVAKSVSDHGGVRIAGGDDADRVQHAAEVIFPPQRRPALLLPEWMHSRWILVILGTDLPMVGWSWWNPACPASFCVASHSNHLILWFGVWIWLEYKHLLI